MAKRDMENPAQQGGRERQKDDLNEGVGTGAEDMRGLADEEDADFEEGDDLEDEDEAEDEGAM